MTYPEFLNQCHPDWHEILQIALHTLDPVYLNELQQDTQWFPGVERIFAAFSLPLEKTRFILLGESPYPRESSANGYAFWDNAVGELWCSKGLTSAVNRATSLRNFIKMLLLAQGELGTGTSQEQIAHVDKTGLVHTAAELFLGMMAKGILLLNVCLVYSEGKVLYHARHWKPFINSIFARLSEVKPEIQLILLGKLAEKVSQDKLPVGLLAEHPYNVSFITNKRVIDFFKPLDLLSPPASC